jgi:hypothetical protein
MHSIHYNTSSAKRLTKTSANWIFPRTGLYRFIVRNAAVFEALARQSAPFGGNVLGH